MVRKEETLEGFLTDYLDAMGRIARTLDAARQRCDRIMRRAEDATADDQEAAREAVKSLHSLISVAEIADLCGLSHRDVRHLLAVGQDDSSSPCPSAGSADETAPDGPDPRDEHDDRGDAAYGRE